MRSARAPIPSPDPLAPRAETYWARAHPQPPPLPGATDRDGHDPFDWIPREAGDIGIDRRRGPRDAVLDDDDDAAWANVVFASHVRWRPLVALRCSYGSAWLRAISICPTGLLAHAIDPADPSLTDAERRELGRQMRRLLPQICQGRSSPLVATGVTLLSQRTAADLSAWAQHPDRHRPTDVELVVAPRPGRDAMHAQGRLCPLNDPSPGVLAIALPPDLAAQWTAIAATSR